MCILTCQKETQHSRGYTLIELLVVIAIISLLSTLSLVALGTARQKARDVKRLVDLRQIQTALEMYKSATGQYPPTTSSISLGDVDHACFDSWGFKPAGTCFGQYLNIPTDPSGRFYTYTGSSTDFNLSAELEGRVGDLSGTVVVRPNASVANQ